MTADLALRPPVIASGEQYEIVPVYREVLADHITPVAAFAQLAEPGAPGFLLESGPDAGGVARYSYIGYRPRLLPVHAGDPLAALGPLLDRTVAPVPGLPPFFGGVLGYLGYESARHFEKLPLSAGAPPGLPESAFLTCDDMVVFDNATRRVLLLTTHRPREESYDEALARLTEIEQRLLGTPPSIVARPLSRQPQTDLLAGWESNVTRAEFEKRVLRAKEYIAAGDAFQIVLSQRFSKPLAADPIDLYRHLRATNPSPYMYHVNLGDGRHIVGASPELLVKNEGPRILTRPLAGTRPRGPDVPSDLALETQLLADEKECAEHVMLVDLGRHDLGRVTVPGTVRVDELMRVERFSHVMHISSTVSGELVPGRTGLDALRSAFPAGTLSGAPKIRAMEIIAELETEQRGVYGGAIGCFGYGGVTDVAIALRTLVIADGQVHVQAGAGIVADSDPAAEYLETCHKAGAVLAAVRAAEASA
ncbi:MAG: chorismate-binding protein [Kibdelosporangium sp.]